MVEILSSERNINKRRIQSWQKGEISKMNLGRSIQKLLTVVLMAMLFFVVFYMDIGILYKVFMAVLVFAIVFLIQLADKTVEQIENRQF